MNARDKGARGEREWRDQLRENGWDATRGQQFSGGAESPDVRCPGLNIHWEVKRVEALNLANAVDQAQRDAKGKPWAVAHRKDRQPWLVTVSANTFFSVLRDGMEGLK